MTCGLEELGMWERVVGKQSREVWRKDSSPVIPSKSSQSSTDLSFWEMVMASLRNTGNL